MIDWVWHDPARVHAMWFVLLFMGAMGWLLHRQREVVGRLLSPSMQARLLVGVAWSRRWAQLVCFGAAMMVGVLALMRPQAKGVVVAVSSGHAIADVMFVLDVSRSMLAEDAAPNRLTRAKAEIANLVRRLPNYRVGLVAFAGRAVEVCPLTPDRGFFEMVLGEVSPATAGRGGTRIGEAVLAALRGFPDGVGAKLLVLITDGEDQESFPLDAAEKARLAGVRIIAVGLGNEAGAPIMITDPQTGAKTPLLYDGQAVSSRLDGATLRQMALKTEGVYIPAGTAALDLESILAKHVRPMVGEGAGATTRVVPAERYPYLLMAMLTLLLVGVALGRRSIPAWQARSES